MVNRRTIRLSTQAFTQRAALDTAVSRAILQRVSEGKEPETLRLFRPTAIVAFGPQDTRSPGYQQAVQRARSGGFQAVYRLAGGRAAVFHEETIAFSWTIPDPEPRAGIHQRFQELADIMAQAFRRLGVDARIGEVPGEYCPGEYSVNARGQKKLMGVGQRLTNAAAHVGGVVVVGQSQRVRDILVPVYDALGVPWVPDTAGSLEDELGTVSCEQVQQAILEEFAARYDVVEEALDSDLLALAESLEPQHAVP